MIILLQGAGLAIQILARGGDWRVIRDKINGTKV